MFYGKGLSTGERRAVRGEVSQRENREDDGTDLLALGVAMLN